MTVPPKDALNDMIAKFIEATGNAALRTMICGACAREMYAQDCKETKISDIPNKELLKPHRPHPAQQLFDSILLYPTAVDQEHQSTVLCQECLSQLKNNRLPKLSLANNLWVGEIPFELRNLTLPERLLLARYFPAAYIVKLFPKGKNAYAWDRSQMHSGLRGNVSTYRLDPRQVASMIDGRTFPPPSRILSATIGVTFIGPKGLPESSLPSMFRVRRRKVRDALTWLKDNNPLYSDIEISEDRLMQLPEDGIPDEITMTVKFSTDTFALEREHAGYVPTENEESEKGKHAHVEVTENRTHICIDELQTIMNAAGLQEVDDTDETTAAEQGMTSSGKFLLFSKAATYQNAEPEIVPIQALGVVDIDGRDITTTELMAHAFANSIEDTQTNEEFQIRRGSAFVNEYARRDATTGLRNDGGPSNPNHLMGCFPTLFPYGRGGFETNRPVDVPYEVQAKWAMMYADKRFRKDPQFPFQVFGVCQKREVCRSAVLQMKQTVFTQNANLISTIKPEDFIKASQEETKKVQFSNPAIRALRKQLTAVRTRVKGTNESRQQVRSKIWGTNLVYNPPSLWITINPSDAQDPIAQVLAGADIDLDRFCDTAGPTNSQRAANMASDPYASAKYFHFIIQCVLEILLGIKKKRNGIFERTDGIFGKIQAYIGTVEAQGRGTLHLHMLIWLKDAPSPQEMIAALKSDLFRNKVKSFINSTIKANLFDKTQEEILAIPRTNSVSYSRPLNPKTSSEEDIAANETNLVRNLQYHQCTMAGCLRSINGRLQCKRRAPFQTADDDWINEDGEWGPKRICGYLNNWNPIIMRCIRSNHDAKLIQGANGQTATLTYYITNYATKNLNRTSNASALLAKRVAYLKAEQKKQTDLNKVNKRLIQACANTLSRDREFSAPEIMTYLMGWGDVYTSHHHLVIYWDSVVRALLAEYPETNPAR